MLVKYMICVIVVLFPN